MSQENVEIVKAVYRGWNERGVDGMQTFLHDDLEYLPAEEGEIIHGRDPLRRYWEAFLEAWDEFDMRPTEFLDSGDRVFNGVAINGRGRGSGVEVAMEFWQVWLIRGDRAARCEEYLNRGEALEAVGLSEQDAHADS
jgi:ketosteroid isomerase-like protein